MVLQRLNLCGHDRGILFAVPPRGDRLKSESELTHIAMMTNSPIAASKSVIFFHPLGIVPTSCIIPRGIIMMLHGGGETSPSTETSPTTE